jgi:carboxypeptidase C (cathepsin A)
MRSEVVIGKIRSVINSEPPTGTGSIALAEPVQTTRHVIDLPAGPLAYRAEAGTLGVRRDDGSALADMFYIAYRAEQTSANFWNEAETTGQSWPRPITFAFGGDLGSPGLWLNIGGLGPRRARARRVQAPALPHELDDNPCTLLSATDLVFIDAPGTGFSRLAPGATQAEAWGVDADADIFARAITRYLTLTDSWQAPRYLLGESYGGTRAAVLAGHLQRQGLDCSGVILLSATLNSAATQPGLDQGYVNLLPSYAATAFHHDKARPAAEEKDFDVFLAQAREFAATRYAQALQRGNRLAEDDEKDIASLLSSYIGLEPALLRRRRLRIDPAVFCRELLAQEGKVVSLLDGRHAADGQYPPGPPAPDPAATVVGSALLAGFHHHLAYDLEYRTALGYRAAGGEAIASAWDWRHAPGGTGRPLPVPNAALDLSAAMHHNPGLRVRVMGGFFDLAAPFAAAEFDVARLHLMPTLAQNVQFNCYTAGHLTYTDNEAVALMASDLRGFYDPAQ